MKKAILIFIALSLIFSVTGCQPKEPIQPKQEKTAATAVADVLAESIAPEIEATPASEPERKEKAELLISAAASMTDVLNELVGIYESTNPDVKITCTYGASGALQTQIEEGAPSDIFISAAQKQMTALEEKGLIINESKKTLLENEVVLIVPTNSTLSINDFADVIKEDVKKIGLGEPEAVPVGQYSEEVFAHLGILDQVKNKAVYGSDVRTVLTWVEEGEVDCGVVYKTDAVTSDKVKSIATASNDSNKAVTYPFAVLKGSKNAIESQAFLNFLASDKAAKIFEKYGFKVFK